MAGCNTQHLKYTLTGGKFRVSTPRSRPKFLPPSCFPLPTWLPNHHTPSAISGQSYCLHIFREPAQSTRAYARAILLPRFYDVPNKTCPRLCKANSRKPAHTPFLRPPACYTHRLPIMRQRRRAVDKHLTGAALLFDLKWAGQPIVRALRELSKSALCCVCAGDRWDTTGILARIACGGRLQMPLLTRTASVENG